MTIDPMQDELDYPDPYKDCRPANYYESTKNLTSGDNMKDSYDCDCGVCGICNGTSKPLPTQKEGTHKWQHEETGRLVDKPHNESPGNGWFRIADK